ncbi:MAG: PLP-dependent aspartate aminotransferase family protein [Bacteroidota bacterium]
MDDKNAGFNTRLIHGGGHEDQYGSATVPIYQTSTFAFESVEHGAKCFAGEAKGFIYSRIANPTVRALERQVADLESGHDGIATSSGMGAVNTLYMALLKSGDHMVSTDAVYGPSRMIMENYFSRYGVEATYINTSNAENIRKAIKPNTKVLYLESPANPTMDITDIAEAVKIAKEHNLITVIDNTFSTPCLQRPLEMGIDVVFHSMTKYLNGHADVVAGMIVTKTKELYDRIRPVMVNTGCNIDPHQAYLVIRGLKTLGIRVERAQENAIKVADMIEKHPNVEWCRFPGLKSHPQYELAQKQMSGPGSMICFELKGGLKAGEIVMNSVNTCILAVSLGGVETLIQHPASMTHSKVPRDSRLKAGITDGLVRLSVGIEDVSDLLADLKQALDKA